MKKLIIVLCLTGCNTYTPVPLRNMYRINHCFDNKLKCSMVIRSTCHGDALIISDANNPNVVFMCEKPDE